MPEGPEVRKMAESLEQLEGKYIARAKVVSGRYKRGAIHDLEKLQASKISRVLVKGKLITFNLQNTSEPFAVLSTMGMTGWWVVLAQKDHEWDKYRRIEIEFDDGTIAAFFDPRNFGTFRVVSSFEAKRKQAELGPDILTSPSLWAAITYPEFVSRIKRFGRHLTLAEAIIDQRIASGCGNYIRADAMYLAKLNPNLYITKMDDAQLQLIWKCMHEVAKASYTDKAVIGEGKFENLVYSKELSPIGCKIESFSDSNDRTVWYSPTEQT